VEINYGFRKVRFPAPVPVGSKLRATLEVLGIEAVAVGWRILQRVTVELDGSAKPACVAESADILIT
jgi:acyl dehydratase